MPPSCSSRLRRRRCTSARCSCSTPARARRAAASSGASRRRSGRGSTAARCSPAASRRCRSTSRTRCGSSRTRTSTTTCAAPCCPSRAASTSSRNASRTCTPAHGPRAAAVELHVIEGLEHGRVALYIKTHHAGLDGASAQLFLRSFVDTTPGPPRAGAAARHGTGFRPRAHRRCSWRRRGTRRAKLHDCRRLARSRQRRGRGGRRARAARGPRRDRPALRPAHAAQRRDHRRAQLRFGRSGAGSRRSRSRARHEATINDVILAACAGALRRLAAAARRAARRSAPGSRAVLDARAGQHRPDHPGLLHHRRPAHAGCGSARAAARDPRLGAGGQGLGLAHQGDDAGGPALDRPALAARRARAADGEPGGRRPAAAADQRDRLERGRAAGTTVRRGRAGAHPTRPCPFPTTAAP